MLNFYLGIWFFLKLRRIIFASTNESKFNEIFLYLKTFNIEIEFVRFESIEIQSNRLEDIALQKSEEAYGKIGEPLIVEDTGLFIDSLKGFPGPYSSFVLDTIGNQGILDLLLKKTKRSALFRSIVAYKDSNKHMTFSGDTKRHHKRAYYRRWLGLRSDIHSGGFNSYLRTTRHNKQNGSITQNTRIEQFCRVVFWKLF
jgi:Xanthosine triphosphate pyrophosphatase